MSQQAKLEKVLDLLINEDTTNATELLHQIIVEKARSIYEGIVDEEDFEDDNMEDSESGDAGDDFTDEIKVDKDDIDSDELNDGETDDDFEDKDQDQDDEDRIEDLEDQLAQLRAEFDALMSDELQEPEHADMLDTEDDFGGDDFGTDSIEDNSFLDGMALESKKAKMKSDMKDKMKPKDKVDEETQFTSKVADTGQKSPNPGFAGTGKNTPKGAEQDKSTFTSVPSKPTYGGKPVVMDKGTGGEPGAYNAGKGKDETPTSNVNTKQKPAPKADTKDGWSGTGKESGSFGSQQKKSPLSKAPQK